MAATIARLARKAKVFTAYVNLNVELASSRAGELSLVCSGLTSQPLLYAPACCLCLHIRSAELSLLLLLLLPFPLCTITKRNLLALICYTLACPASFSPLSSLSLCPFAASICAVLHFRASVCISFMAFSLCAQPKNEKSENKTKYSCTSYV